MAFSKVDICNMAILDAGGDPINSVPDGTKKESNLIVQFYDFELDFLLGEHPWRFAKKWASLAENAAYTFTDDTYGAAWALPSDFIRFSDLENIGPSYVFARRDSHLLTYDYDEFEIEYIARITDTTKFPNYFIMAFRKLLASDLATPLRRKGAKDVAKMQQEFFLALDNAKLKDAREDKQSTARIQNHTTDNDSWITSRG